MLTRGTGPKRFGIMKRSLPYFASFDFASFAVAAAVLLVLAPPARSSTASAFALDTQTSNTAQNPVAAKLPGHILLPVLLVHTVDSRHVLPGQPILGKTVQPIQIGPNQWIPKGALVHGRIVAVQPASGPANVSGASTSAGRGPSITFEFHRVTSKNGAWTMKTSLLAMASLMEVYDATEPATNFDDRGNNNEHAWTMRQIGGDMVYHDTGWIYNRYGEKVGTEDSNGNYALPVARSDGGPALPLALGLFSTNAKGAYGMPGYNIYQTGPATQITAGPAASHLHLPYGISMLLETEP